MPKKYNLGGFAEGLASGARIGVALRNSARRSDNGVEQAADLVRAKKARAAKAAAAEAPAATSEPASEVEGAFRRGGRVKAKGRK